jgi:hypothetical protein
MKSRGESSGFFVATQFTDGKLGINERKFLAKKSTVWFSTKHIGLRYTIFHYLYSVVEGASSY